MSSLVSEISIHLSLVSLLLDIFPANIIPNALDLGLYCLAFPWKFPS